MRLLIFISMFLPQIILADSFENSVVELERQIYQIAEGYFDYISLRHKNEINRYFALTSADHNALVYGINRLAEDDLAEVQEIDQLFEILKREISYHPERINEISSQIFSLYSRSYSLRKKSQDYYQDLSLVEWSWSNYCSEARFNFVEQYFQPSSHYAPSQDVGYLEAPMNPYHFSVSGGFSTDGSAQSIYYSSDRPGASESEKEAWNIAATVVGAIAEGFCAVGSGGASSGGCFAIGTAVVQGVRFLVDAIRFAGEVRRVVRLENRQATARRYLYDHQLTSIQRLQEESSNWVKEQCDHFFYPDKEWPQKRIIGLGNAAQEVHLKIDGYIRGELDFIRQRQYEYLLNHYLPNLIDGFWHSLHNYYQEREITDDKVIQFSQEFIVPLLGRMDEAKTLTEKTLLEQKLWTEVIIGDARFHKDDGFSFIDISDQDESQPLLGNIWLQLGQSILQQGVRP
jgi:hypothetical protein